MDIDNFLSNIASQAHPEKSKEEVDRLIPQYFLKYLNDRTPQVQAMLNRGYSEVQYMAYSLARACVSRDVAIEFVTQKFAVQYLDVQTLVDEFDATFSATEPDEKFREKNFSFLSGKALVAEFPPVSRSSYVTAMSLKQAEKSMWILTGGWRKIAPMTPGQKEFNATKRALELFEYGFSESYVSQYISTLVDGVEITQGDVANIVSVARETAVRMSTLNTKKFKLDYYK